MKQGKLGGLGKKEQPLLSTKLADALKIAIRAAQVEQAVRWGTRVLFWGGALVATAAWGLGAGASTVRVGVVSVLITAVCVGWLVALKRASRTTARRDLALLAARRLEKKFPERVGVIVAAVDFCEDEADGDRGVTSETLRGATVAAATRRWSEIASQLDEAELNAVLTDLPIERFRKIGKKRLICAFCILINWAVWAFGGERAVGKKSRDGENAVASSSVKKIGATLLENGRDESDKQKEKNGVNEENEKNSENEAVAENRRTIDDAAPIEAKETNAEEISLASLELLIVELAQNAEIAESLQAELERRAAETVNEENKEDADVKRLTGADATQFLQLARELKANLTRPRTGLVAQVNLLNELACRERLESEERWALLVKKWREKSESTKKEGGGDGDKTGKTDEKAEADERADQPRWATVKIDGKEVAVCLAASRWTRFKTDLTEPGGIGDIASLGLSRVLRCDSPAEREKMLTEAAARVEEWGAALRREETAARIFCESWRFDAASQRRRALLTLAFKENRTMLLTFAGRASWPGGAAESDKTLDETKRRFNFLWNEAQMVENELVAIVERLRERLQDERARSFIAFAEENGGVAVGAWLWSVEADKAVFASLCRMTSQIASRNAEVARNVENNWFGIAAERLEKTDVTSWRIESPLTDRSSETAVAAEGDEDAGARCRFSALAALLTFGVDENETRQMKTQLNEIEEVALLDGGSDRLGESGTEANETAKDDEPNAEIDATASKEAGGKAGDSSEESKTLDGVVSSENIEGLETRNEELSGATVGETGNQEGANSDGGAWNERGKQDKQKQETLGGKAFSGELPDEARRRFEGTKTPEILPEYEEKIRRYRRRILDERR